MHLRMLFGQVPFCTHMWLTSLLGPMKRWCLVCLVMWLSICLNLPFSQDISASQFSHFGCICQSHLLSSLVRYSGVLLCSCFVRSEGCPELCTGCCWCMLRARTLGFERAEAGTSRSVRITHCRRGSFIWTSCSWINWPFWNLVTVRIKAWWVIPLSGHL